jgi:hypothetical protein
MPNLVEDFISSLGPEVSKKMSSHTNIDEGSIQKLLPVITPMILGGLKKQKDERGGQERVDHILNKYGDPSVLNNLDDLFQNKLNDNKTDPNLGGLLGNSGMDATNLLSNNFKVDPNIAAKIIPMLAPIVLGFLTKKRDGGTGSSGLSSLLDQDGDGSILDDVAGLFLGGSSQSSNPLSNLLGGLLGGNK